MEDLRKLLKDAYDERATLSQEVAVAECEYGIANGRYRSWGNGFLFKRVFKRAFAVRGETSETAEAKLEELREQLRLTTLATQIDMDRGQSEPYYRMRDDFAALTECQKIWDTLDRRAVDRLAERSAAHEAIRREPVAFALDYCDLIQWEQRIPHLPNRTGGDMYVYPGFILYRASRQAFALIDSREVTLTFKVQRFIEDGPVPSNTQVVGQAWAKSNKDGSPDRRFRDNYQMPIVLYGSLTFTSTSGLREEYQFSNPDLAERFGKSWNLFQAALANDGPTIPSNGSVSPTAIRDIAPCFDRLKSANDALFNTILTSNTIPDDDFSAYFRIVSEFVDTMKGFAADVAASVGWIESLGVPKKKLSHFRTMQPSFQRALERFEMAYRRFEMIPATDNPIIGTEDVTA